MKKPEQINKNSITRSKKILNFIIHATLNVMFTQREYSILEKKKNIKTKWPSKFQIKYAKFVDAVIKLKRENTVPINKTCCENWTWVAEFLFIEIN